MPTMDVRLAIEIVIGVVLGVAGWSLRVNFGTVSKKLDEVARDVRSVAAVSATQSARIAVLDQRITSMEQRLLGVEERERAHHFSKHVSGDVG
jgi:uncharacterized membrane protein